MSKKAVTITAIIILAFFILGIFIPMGLQFVHAETLQQQLNKASQKKDEAKKKADTANSNKKKTLEENENLERDIGIIQTQIDSLDSKLEETNNKLAIEEARLKEATEKAENQYEGFKERFRVMCEDGSVSYIDLLFSAQNLSDFIDRIEIAKEISSYDKKVFDAMEENRKEIEDSKNQIQTLKNNQESTKTEKSNQMSALSSKMKEQQTYVKELESDIEAYNKTIEESEKAMDALKAQIQASLSKSVTTGNGTVNTGKAYVGGEFLWPSPSCYIITSQFSNARPNPVSGIVKKHTGVDIGARFGASIVAANAGTVTLAGWNSGYGNCVVIDHGGGKATLYGHMSSILVSTGQQVEKGQQIGKVGSTGNSTGPHLHFEILINGTAVNPMQYFK